MRGKKRKVEDEYEERERAKEKGMRGKERIRAGNTGMTNGGQRMKK
jgi:hypothetical protein